MCLCCIFESSFYRYVVKQRFVNFSITELNTQWAENQVLPVGDSASDAHGNNSLLGSINTQWKSLIIDLIVFRIMCAGVTSWTRVSRFSWHGHTGRDLMLLPFFTFCIGVVLKKRILCESWNIASKEEIKFSCTLYLHTYYVEKRKIIKLNGDGFRHGSTRKGSDTTEASMESQISQKGIQIIIP